MAKAVFERSNPPLYRVYDGETLVLKRCAKCEQHKKPTAFHKDASRKDGLMLRCRECCGVNVNRKPLTVEEKRRRQRKYDAAYKARNRKRSTAQIEKDRKRLRPEGVKKCRECLKTKPLIYFANTIAYGDGLETRCKMCDTERRLKVDVSRLLRRWEDLGLYACVYCDAPFEDIEHTIPRAQGGTDHIENLVPSCANCNRGPGGKHARTPAEWRPAQHAEMRAIIGRLRQMQD